MKTYCTTSVFDYEASDLDMFKYQATGLDSILTYAKKYNCSIDVAIRAINAGLFCPAPKPEPKEVIPKFKIGQFIIFSRNLRHECFVKIDAIAIRCGQVFYDATRFYSKEEWPEELESARLAGEKIRRSELENESEWGVARVATKEEERGRLARHPYTLIFY
jgi:hypothetical protein